jgi:hypothetical protein
MPNYSALSSWSCQALSTRGRWKRTAGLRCSPAVRLPDHKYLLDECCLGCNCLTQAMSWWNGCLGNISLIECRLVGPEVWEWRWEPERRLWGRLQWTGQDVRQPESLALLFPLYLTQLGKNHKPTIVARLCNHHISIPYLFFSMVLETFPSYWWHPSVVRVHSRSHPNFKGQSH